MPVLAGVIGIGPVRAVTGNLGMLQAMRPSFRMDLNPYGPVRPARNTPFSIEFFIGGQQFAEVLNGPKSAGGR
jgi:hypothetical protein